MPGPRQRCCVCGGRSSVFDTGAREMADRLTPTLALTVLGRALGVNIFRVHDVLENVRALAITDAVLNA